MRTFEQFVCKHTRFLVVLALTVLLSAFVVCGIIASSNGHVSFDSVDDWPHLSNLGARKPEHIVFACGLTLAAFLLAVVIVVYARKLSSLARSASENDAKRSMRFVHVIHLAGLAAAFGLSSLSILPLGSSNEHVVDAHNASAAVCFVTLLILSVTNNYASFLFNVPPFTCEFSPRVQRQCWMPAISGVVFYIAHVSSPHAKGLLQWGAAASLLAYFAAALPLFDLSQHFSPTASASSSLVSDVSGPSEA
ncbi:MAG: hypothetical protein MHM6MM_003234 [Cercozoa sp. M6MM]